MKLIKFFTKARPAYIKTFIINFRALPLQQAYKFPIIIYDPSFRLTSIGKIRIITKDNMTRGMVEIGKGDFFNIGSGELMNSGTITFLGKCTILKGAKINNQGYIEFGENSRIGENMKIIIRQSLIIGKMTRFPYDTVIMDSSGHPILDLTNHTVSRFIKAIKIGDYCWIGHSCTINGGTILPDHTIVSTNSLLNRDYSINIKQYSLIGGVPAHLLKENVLKINNLSIWFDCLHKFNQNPNLYSIDLSSIIET